MFERVIVSDTLLRSQFSSQICFRKRLIFGNQNINNNVLEGKEQAQTIQCSLKRQNNKIS